ncbi:MAG: sulfite reductase [Candidatus Bathyarchaeia archaeon]|jgi:Mn-dependent DtxR family transcriptional regulator
MTTPPTMDETKEKVLQHLQRIKQGASRDIAKSIKIDKHLVDNAIDDLITEGKLIYVSYGGVTYVAIPGAVKSE